MRGEGLGAGRFGNAALYNAALRVIAKSFGDTVICARLDSYARLGRRLRKVLQYGRHCVRRCYGLACHPFRDCTPRVANHPNAIGPNERGTNVFMDPNSGCDGIESESTRKLVAIDYVVNVADLAWHRCSPKSEAHGSTKSPRFPVKVSSGRPLN
jgi:hypothetical protein